MPTKTADHSTGVFAGLPAESAAPAIGDYALIGDCRTAALISRDGGVDWLCLPDFSGPSVFAALLDYARGGTFRIRPKEPFRCTRRYIGTTAVLETTFSLDGGMVRVTDAMPVSSSPGAISPMRELLRIVEGVQGDVVLDVLWTPRPKYAAEQCRIESRRALGWVCSSADELFLLRCERPLRLSGSQQAIVGEICVRAGEKVRFSLSYTKADIATVPLLGKAADARIQHTLSWWEEWLQKCPYNGPHGEAVLRSAITLKLLTYALSGAVVAAPTSSLPETLGSDRNWDYRYCWLRDAAMTMQAFTGLGFRDEATAFLQWLLHATRLTWPELQVMYDVYGRTNIKERELPHLAGHHSSRPVRVGNGAHTQMQLDVYGEIVLAALDCCRSGQRLQTDEAKLLAGFGNTIIRKWREPDHGIWEIRGAPRHYTFSKLMCWAALDGLLKLGADGHVRIDSAPLIEAKNEIEGEIESRGFNTGIGSYTSEFDGDRVDAALLLIPMIGYRKAEHPRVRSTFDRIHERLGSNGLLYRYERNADGLSSPEGAFGICSFWAIQNLALRGDDRAGEDRLAQALAYANDVGLFAEEIDVKSGAALGNFPQAFTHVGLINAALSFNRPGRN